MRVLGAAALTVLGGAIVGGTAAQTGPSHAKTTLLVERQNVAGGKTLWAGVRFQLEDGWHIYWKNPGDSGEPPRIQWQLPPGFRAGKIRWPTPVVLGKPPIVDYGYEKEVLLAVPIAVPAGYARGKPATIHANVKYIVCREVCVPAKAALTATVPRDAGSADASLFEKARGEMPRRAPKTWRLSARSEGDFLTLRVSGISPKGEVRFLPAQESVIENAAPQVVTAAGRGFEMRLKKSDELLKPVSRLNGLLKFADGRAYEISAPVRGH